MDYKRLFELAIIENKEKDDRIKLLVSQLDKYRYDDTLRSADDDLIKERDVAIKKLCEHHMYYRRLSNKYTTLLNRTTNYERCIRKLIKLCIDNDVDYSDIGFSKAIFEILNNVND